MDLTAVLAVDSLGIPILAKGILMGVTAALIGWAKSTKPGNFSLRGVLFKMPAGIVVGLVAAYQGIEFNAALEWATGVGVVEILDQVTKAGVRVFKPGWMKLDQDITLEYDPETIATIIKLSEGKDLTRDDIINGTELFRGITSKILDMNDPLDREFKQHVDFVANQILQNVRKHGWSGETYENAGKMLFRLFQVWRRYRTNKRILTPQEWAEEIKTIVKAMQAIFEVVTD